MNDELRALGSIQTRGIVLLLLVALAGGAGGGALDRMWMVHRAQVEQQAGWTAREVARREPRREPGAGTEDGRTVLREPEIPVTLRAIDLTSQQKEKIRAIMSRFQPTADSIMRSVRPRVMELDFRMRQEAMCVLTPKQRDDWIAWRKREHLNVEEGGAMLKLVTTNACPSGTTTP